MTTPNLDAMCAPLTLDVGILERTLRLYFEQKDRADRAEHMASLYLTQRNDAHDREKELAQERDHNAKLASDAAAECNRLRELYQGADRAYLDTMEELERVRHIAEEDQRNFATQRKQHEAEVLALRGEVAQVDRRAQRAEAGPWRDAKLGTPDEAQLVLARDGRKNHQIVYFDDGWRRSHDGELVDSEPTHWLPLSALPPLTPREHVTVDLPAVECADQGDNQQRVTCGVGFDDVVIWMPVGTQIPATWVGKPLRLTLEVREP